MSFTVVSTPEKTSTIYLSPSKRLRISDEGHMPTYTAKELFSWTFSAESVALCTVNDVLAMKKNTVDNYDFFYLGKVPCRCVEIVGMVVGVKECEKKFIYTVDDGTSVVDCVHPHPKRPAAHTKYQRAEKEDQVPPKPSVYNGNIVRISGCIRNRFESRIIHLNRIERCTSPNEELFHAKLVRQLRRTSYSSNHAFVIPSQVSEPTLATPSKKPLETPLKKSLISMPSPSPPSSIASSPVKSSPLALIPQSPPKLRHPSRLHTHDLTENTFRIYVKHYMAHFSYSQPNPLDESDDASGISLDNLPVTPTKRSRLSASQKTPRSMHSTNMDNNTPKAPHSFSDACRATISSSSQQVPHIEGFTLSYLRRVPELSLLASRVVQAVTKRRQREERKGAKANGTRCSSSKVPVTSSSNVAVPPTRFAAQVKRLFNWAVRQLLQDGDIILWDGPIRRCPDSMMTDSSRIWTTNLACTSESLSLVDPFSSSGYISDPLPNEEAYISLTPSYLAPFVENAFQVLIEQHQRMAKPYAGVTKEGISSVLRKDDRWRSVGCWSIADALEVLKSQNKAWVVGKGRWDLTS